MNLDQNDNNNELKAMFEEAMNKHNTGDHGSFCTLLQVIFTKFFNLDILNFRKIDREEDEKSNEDNTKNDEFALERKTMFTILLSKYAISGYWSKLVNNDDVKKAIDYLLFFGDERFFNKGNLLINSLFYISDVRGLVGESVRFVDLSPELPLLPTSKTQKYNPINPSVLVESDGTLTVLVRGVNFTSDQGKNYRSMDNDGKVRTFNLITKLDNDFKIDESSSHEMYDNFERKLYPAWVLGLEDCRLFRNDKDETFFTATSCQTDNHHAKLVICKTTKLLTEITNLARLKPPDEHRVEKNWLPFFDSSSSKYLAIYGYNPVSIRQIDTNTGLNWEIISNKSPFNFNTFRGSGGPINFNYRGDDGKLVVIHEVSFGYDNKRTYIHRFVWLDKAYNIKAISRSFYFLKIGIEFCSSLAIKVADDRKTIIAGFGKNDEEAYLCLIDYDDVTSCLIPTEDLLI